MVTERTDRADDNAASGDAHPAASTQGLGRAGSREELEREIRLIQKQLEQLGREAIEQGTLREPAEQGQYFVERARLEERLESLRRELSPAGLEELSEEERAALGRRYTIRLPDGSVETWELTAPGQANPRAGRISVQSPLGRALVGKSRGEVAEVRTPGETYTVEIIDVT